jgi:AraC-like DNA-binding protein
VPEICISLAGAPALLIEGAARALPPGSVAILHPGVSHCEACARAGTRYELMWLILSPSSLLAMVIRYEPRQGWDCVSRAVTQTPAVARLHGAVADRSSPIPPDLFDRFSADLIAVLGQLLQRAVISEPAALGPPSDRHGPLLEHVRGFIDDQLDRPLSLARLARLTRLSPGYLGRLFREWSGESLHRYVTRRRMEEAMRLCAAGGLLVKEVARRVGFDDPLYFSRAFQRHHGRRPSAVRRSGRAMSARSARSQTNVSAL